MRLVGKASSRRPAAGNTSVVESERALLAGLVELLTDDVQRCREGLALVEADALTIDGGPALVAAVREAVGLVAPSLADVARIIREHDPLGAADGTPAAYGLMLAAVELSRQNPAGYAKGVERHAKAVARARAKRRAAVAALDLVAAADDPRVEPEAIVAAAGRVLDAAAAAPSDRLQWQQFPVELLPEPVRAFATQAWATLDRTADVACVVLPVLAALAGAIGNRRRIASRAGWSEPAVLWCAIVAESGSKKSPAADKALWWTRERDAAAIQERRILVREWERAVAEARRSGATVPEKPPEVRYAVNDVTVEALATKLENSPQVLLDRDELSGWIASFDRYASGKGGGDVSLWLPCYNAAGWTVDRKGSGTIHVRRAAVSIAGGIQPKVLARSFGPHVDNGLLQRFILAQPPEGDPQWPEGDVDFVTMADMQRVFDTLYSLCPDADGNPQVLDLEPDALDLYRRWWHDNGVERTQAIGPVKSMLSKADAWALRLALVCHLVRQAGLEPTLANRVDATSMSSGIGLARWAAAEWRRVYGLMQGGGGGPDDAALARWIAGRPGRTTVRDVQRLGPPEYRVPGAAEAGIARLVEAGQVAPPAPTPTGGRPAEAVEWLQ